MRVHAGKRENDSSFSLKVCLYRRGIFSLPSFLTPFADEPLTSGGMLGDACRLLCLSAYTRVGLSK